MSMRVFHATSNENAMAILTEGFKDDEGSYLTPKLWRGVRISNIPLDENNAGGNREALLEVTLDLTDAELADYEWIEEGKTYKEWLVPADLLNSRGRVRLVDPFDDEGSSGMA